MAKASRLVLAGLRTDCSDEFDAHGKPVKCPHIIRHPRRFMDERGIAMWDKVANLIKQCSARTIEAVA
jgi:hypothetical protein